MVKLDTGTSILGKKALPSLSDFFGAPPTSTVGGKGSKRARETDEDTQIPQSSRGKKSDEWTKENKKAQLSEKLNQQTQNVTVQPDGQAQEKKSRQNGKNEKGGRKGHPESNSEGQHSDSGEEGDDDKAERTIFVGGVPIAATPKAIKKFFKVVGPIESVRLRSIPVENPVIPKRASIAMGKLNTARETCNAYVVFKSIEDAMKALDLHGASMSGHVIKVDRASRGAQRNTRLSVFVGNLPFNAEEAEVRKHFAGCGAVTDVRLIRDGQTTMGKGFGYVSFADSDQVQKAVTMNGSTFKKRPLRVFRAARRPKDKPKMDPASLSGAQRRLATRGRLPLDGKDKGPGVDKGKLPKFKKKSKAGLNELGQVKGGKKRMRDKKLKTEAKKMRKHGPTGKKPRKA